MAGKVDPFADDTLEIPDCWAVLAEIDGNFARQLISPAGRAVLEPDTSGRTWAATPGGKWPVVLGDEEPEGSALSVRIGRDRVAEWVGEVRGVGPGRVLESLADRFRFTEGSLDEARPGLRQPQLGAIHAVLGYWATGSTQPATVVMPTGTGKTDTMIGIFAAARPHRLLVIVPTDALRSQLARKFETYGVLVAAGALAEPVIRPAVGVVEHAFQSKATAIAFTEQCNIIVATVAALAASPEDVRRALVDECTHLFVDEAHHITATKWAQIRDYFTDKAIVQFTATPFRADGRHLGGRVVFAFPLRLAQQQGYFATIDYIPITDFVDPDTKIARTAVQRLRDDLAAGLDHLLMARVNSIRRADEIITIYRTIAPDLNPVKVHSGQTSEDRKAALAQVDSRTSRIIVCVDMLGEGYDLPSLKVAAIHDAHKTLPVTLQFIGRFTRVSKGRIGDACVVINRPDPDYDESLHRLYAEDADWNHVIREIAETAVGIEQNISDFDTGFGSSLPEDVPIHTLAPKMSTVVYRTACSTWHPEAACDYFGPERLLTPSIAINRQKNLAWLVTEERSPVRWGNLKTVEEIAYNLYVLYWDSERNLLYINSSNNESVHKQLAETVCGASAEIIKGEVVYRVMARVNRLVPTNVGLIDVRSRARRFSMHVGADVTEGFPVAEAQTKTKTNIFAFGFENGERVSFGGSLKGRVWSYRAARSLLEWADWCDSVGSKLIDESISVDAVMRDFIRPMEVRERPKLIVLGVDWPHEVYFNTSDEARLSYKGISAQLIEADLRVTEHSDDGPIRFAVVTPKWTAAYEAAFTPNGIVYKSIGPEARINTGRKENLLREMFAELGLKFFFEDDTTIELGGFLLRPPRNTPPFRRDRLTAIDWTDIDIKKESQGADRHKDSIQHHVIQRVLSERKWDVVIDDDGAGEAADIVALAVDDDGLLIRLVHCKYSSEDQPGARVDDLYELCGQAHKSVRWKRAHELVDHLIRREQIRQAKYGRSGFEVGDEAVLRGLQYRVRSLRPRLMITIAQPGLSAAKVSAAQLQLLACAEVYLHETAMAEFEVLCSP